jgi:tagaturonate reductase
MNLSKANVARIENKNGISIPSPSYFDLPEKVLQFGTGVLLRGLPDYFIDKANKQGLFNGRVVVVKSTSQGATDAFAEQDGLYTLCVRGYANGQSVDELYLNASISRVLSAIEEWETILACAANPEIKLIISNTTEVGIALVDDDIFAAPPISFPGKLLAFLYKRYQLCKGATDGGLVIIPTELITDNGLKLKEIVIEQAKRHHLENAFIDWLLEANNFCNSLVDRIVPGKLSTADKVATEARLGYTDELMIMSEVYSLWAIETTKSSTKEILSFSAADDGVVLTENISKFKELKLRLLNGSHTFTCSLALLQNFTIVKESMNNESFYSFISNLVEQEIVPAILTENISSEEALAFGRSVLDRYKNPFIEHKWLSISVQYTMKMKMRNVPTLFWHYEKVGTVPMHMAAGFAAYLLFMRSTLKADGSYVGVLNGKEYIIDDQSAAILYHKWQELKGGTTLVENILVDTNLWGQSLAVLPEFANAVTTKLEEFMQQQNIQTV